MKKYILYTDGGARGNPGSAAAGMVIYDEDKNELDSFAAYLGETTNNQAEYQALVMGLGRVFDIADKENSVSEAVVEAFLDSELIVRQLNGEYKIKNKDLKPLFVKAEELAGKFSRVIFKHIPREENSVADALLNDELDNH
ncbi:MAG: ribonuclease HI family protein [Patescibacteria group bacterium]|nr:ribonuclease HI family protein [Patescibacteria group bacterium]